MHLDSGSNREGMTLQNTYKTRKELRLVRAEVVVTRRKAFETDWELDVA